MNLRLYFKLFTHFNIITLHILLNLIFLCLVTLSLTHTALGHSYRYNSDAELQTYLASATEFKIVPP